MLLSMHLCEILALSVGVSFEHFVASSDNIGPGVCKSEFNDYPLCAEPLSIWRQITEGLSSKRSSLLDLSSLEDEFLDEHPEILNADDEIHILSTSDSLNLNLFLSRMDSNPDSLADCLLEGEIDEVGLPALRALNKIIPSSDQVSLFPQKLLIWSFLQAHANGWKNCSYGLWKAFLTGALICIIMLTFFV